VYNDSLDDRYEIYLLLPSSMLFVRSNCEFYSIA
jgi:hypothetical protein